MKNLKLVIAVLLFSIISLSCEKENSIVYSANISQIDELNPTAEVFENSFGGITWERVEFGYYRGVFDEKHYGSTFVIIGGERMQGESIKYSVFESEIQIFTFGKNEDYLKDNVLNNTSIEIRFYEN